MNMKLSNTRNIEKIIKFENELFTTYNNFIEEVIKDFPDFYMHVSAKSMTWDKYPHLNKTKTNKEYTKGEFNIIFLIKHKYTDISVGGSIRLDNNLYGFLDNKKDPPYNIVINGEVNPIKNTEIIKKKIISHIKRTLNNKALVKDLYKISLKNTFIVIENS